MRKPRLAVVALAIPLVVFGYFGAVRIVASGSDRAGLDCYQRHDYTCARVRFGQAVDLVPSVAAYHHHFGMALYQQGLIDQAALEFREAVRIDPTHVNASKALTIAERARDSRH